MRLSCVSTSSRLSLCDAERALLLRWSCVLAALSCVLQTDLSDGPAIFNIRCSPCAAILSGENWNGIMRDLMIQPPFCDPAQDNCGRPNTAVFYCVSFMVSRRVYRPLNWLGEAGCG